MKEKEADCKILIPSNEQQQDKIAFRHEHGKEKDWSSEVIVNQYYFSSKANKGYISHINNVKCQN